MVILTKAPSPEEAYFIEHNKALLERHHREATQRRKEEEKLARKNTHWMKCPKCGHDMIEIELAGLAIDECTDCKGVYFDHGELDVLLKAKEPGKFLKALGKIFK
jgi:uncharacterized protein